LPFIIVPITKTSKYTWRDHKTDEETLNELNVTEWIQHVNRNPRSKSPNLFKKNAQIGIRNQGRPLKRLVDT
jgi:hypothetical protein